MIAYALQDRIVAAELQVPGLLPLADRMNARYQRFGQRWQPRDSSSPSSTAFRISAALLPHVPRRLALRRPTADE